MASIASGLRTGSAASDALVLVGAAFASIEPAAGCVVQPAKTPVDKRKMRMTERAFIRTIRGYPAPSAAASGYNSDVLTVRSVVDRLDMHDRVGHDGELVADPFGHRV